MVTHDEFIKEIKAKIQSLGLLTLTIPSYLAKGFKPDMLVMCGPDEGDRVFIEAINSRDSLNRDIGGLLKLKANLDKDRMQYRKIIAVCSDRIPEDDLKDAYALQMAQPKFHLSRIQGLNGRLRMIVIEAICEKLDQLEKDDLEWYFTHACPYCGEPYNITTLYKPDGKSYTCNKCGFKWLKPKGF